MLKRKKYGALVSKHGFSNQRLHALPMSQYLTVTGLLTANAAGGLNRQVDKALLAAKYLREERRPVATDTAGVYRFTGRHDTYLVDLNDLTCTCPHFTEHEALCSHLMVAIAMFGSIGLDVAKWLALYDLKHLAEQWDLKPIGRLARAKRPMVLALLASFIVRRSEQDLVQTLMGLSRDHPEGRIRHRGVRPVYTLTIGVGHNVDLDTPGCRCHKFDVERWCEGLLIILLTQLPLV
jgi:hypothetical protein